MGPALTLGVGGRIVQRNQFPRRVVLFSQRILGVRVDYRQDVSAADSTENEVLLVNGDNSVSFLEYRIVVHRALDAKILNEAQESKVYIYYRSRRPTSFLRFT